MFQDTLCLAHHWNYIASKNRFCPATIIARRVTPQNDEASPKSPSPTYRSRASFSPPPPPPRSPAPVAFFPSYSECRVKSRGMFVPLWILIFFAVLFVFAYLVLFVYTVIGLYKSVPMGLLAPSTHGYLAVAQPPTINVSPNIVLGSAPFITITLTETTTMLKDQVTSAEPSVSLSTQTTMAGTVVPSSSTISSTLSTSSSIASSAPAAAMVASLLAELNRGATSTTTQTTTAPRPTVTSVTLITTHLPPTTTLPPSTVFLTTVINATSKAP
ncbi:hypothetical protein BJ546DRAFT_989565 [Cryomyces antarcticus]